MDRFTKYSQTSFHTPFSTTMQVPENDLQVFTEQNGLQQH